MESNGDTKASTRMKTGRSLLLLAYLEFTSLVELIWDLQEVDLMVKKFFKLAWTKESNKFTSSVEMVRIEASMS